MPGMMDTVLNLGLNDESVEGLAAQTGDERFAFDSYRRFIAMYGRIVLEIPGEGFDERFDDGQGPAGATSDAQVPVATAQELVDEYKADRRARTPASPSRRTRPSSSAAPSRPSSAVLERPARLRLPRPRAHPPRPRHRGQRPGDGLRQPRRQLGHRRRLHPRPGHRREQALRGLPGQRPGRGRRGRHPQHRADLDALKKQFPEVHKELLAIFDRLERHYRDMCDTEFTIEQGKLWMLQTRVGKRTGRRRCAWRSR